MKTKQIATFTRRTQEMYRRLMQGTLPVEATLAGLQNLIQGGYDSIVDLDADPFIPDGWSLESHAKGGKFDFYAPRIGFYLSKKQQDRGALEGRKLRKELQDQPVFNANLLDWLLRKENQRFIPAEWAGQEPCFWGTIYRITDGSLSVRQLCMRGGGWCSGGYSLDYGFGSGHPAAVLVSA